MSDGRHDFEFELGIWRMSPSGDTHIVRKLWDGGSIAQLRLPKPAPHIRGSLLKLYNPKTHDWSVYWADAVDGTLSPPMVGKFSHGLGTFVGNDRVGGHRVLVRLTYRDITTSSFKTTQSTSSDAGKAWSHAVTETYTREQ
jgi:hypothetical protein